ncbi:MULTISPECIES: DUF3280 domain-containing protein [unclassified Bradyrhizobium]|uniref:DUF3280 domain-containing protein n=1 Tax=unclassified Bradyrhizobium TaxID=2631580 RepID=UPI00247A745C|nr:MULTISPECIES: DUF3280 domain-containing protein [unclassified Bradyrhizobium]WGR74514.1 DUF3280 domain-containing protein [Bradyrhizobium sp. ISRA426]WGR79349.1 DUF3280 domain-containing protein [Bradyrhizobium sp. ISRA430]WGR89686.1 DUF3280 domain-containing protein [Bradyrhizobium sp. ISRA432]
MRRSPPVFVSILLLVLRAAAASAAEPGSVAIDDFSYLDTSGEPANQTAAHEKRLAAFMAALRRDIAAGERYRLVPTAQDGAAFKIIGGIQKTSTLVQWAKVAVIDVAARKVVMDKLYTFRGDNDEAWEHAERFVAREILAALAAPAPIALAVFEFELDDNTAAPAVGLAATDSSYLTEVTTAVRDALGQSGRYRIVDVSGVREDAVRSRALRDCNGCDAAIAAKLGADQSLIGVVRRVSRTEYTIGFQVRDARTGAVVSRGDSGLRMGADYSWKRGAVRLVSDRLIEGAAQP